MSPIFDPGDITDVYNVLHTPNYLLNGSSEVMEVNGGTTPVVFSFSPSAGQTSYLYGLSFLLLDGGTMDSDDFGAGLIFPSGLTNGILIEASINGTNYTICNIKTNTDIKMFFPFEAYTPPGAAFLDETDLYFGMMKFDVPIRLQNDTSDYIRATVRDNISTIDLVRMMAYNYRVV